MNKIIERQISLNTYNDRADLLVGKKPHKERQKDKVKDNRHDTFILIDNTGARNIIVNAVKTVDNVTRLSTNIGLRFLPTVRRGKNIMSVMNKIRKQEN
jgi:hypothetical protein